MLLRTREETPEEVIGFVDACRELIEGDVQTLTPTLDIGCYAGKRRQLPWYLLAVAVLAAEGHRIMLHGAHEPGSDDCTPVRRYRYSGLLRQKHFRR